MTRTADGDRTKFFSLNTKNKKEKILLTEEQSMIKGINRQVVEVRETGSEYFERILFFVKPEYAAVSEGKIRERAGLIADKTAKPPMNP